MTTENTHRSPDIMAEDNNKAEIHRTNHLLVIGIDEYAHIKPLNNAARDAQTISALLTKNYDCEIVDKFPPLYGKDATIKNITDTFKRLATFFKEKPYSDNLLVYYAGHGEWDDDLEMGYWLPFDAKEQENHTYLSNENLIAYINAIKSHHTLIITDSCFSGSLIQNNEKRGNRKEAMRSRYILASGLKDEKVDDGVMGKHSPFATCIINFLEENVSAPFRLTQLEGYVDQYFRENNFKQTPILAPLNLIDHQHGDLIFYPKRSAASVFLAAKQAQSIAQLERFLEDFPDSKFEEEAEVLLKDLRWQKINADPDPINWLQFVREHRLHDQFPKVIEKLEHFVKNAKNKEKLLKQKESDIIKLQNTLDDRTRHFTQENKTQKDAYVNLESEAKKVQARHTESLGEYEKLKDQLYTLEENALNQKNKYNIEITQLRQELEKKDQTILNLGSEAKKVQARHTELLGEYEKLKDQLYTLEENALNQKNTFNNEIAQLRQELIKKDQTIQGLQKEIQTLTEKSSSQKNFDAFIEVKGTRIELPEMVYVQGGTFQMGSDQSDREKPIHSVSIQDFWIAKYPLTFAQYDGYCKAFGIRLPSDNKWGRGNRPLINISWAEAQAYCKRISEVTRQAYRLPSEAEWEYAARGGQKSQGYRYAGGNDINQVAWYDKNSGGQTQPVGLKAPNELGIYDMSGNVWEWCEDDWHKSYQDAPKDGSAWIDSPRGLNRVHRGGSWDDDAAYSRVSNRLYWSLDNRSFNLGFRPVLASQFIPG